MSGKKRQEQQGADTRRPWRWILRAIGKVLYNGEKKKNPRVSGMTRLTSIAENVVLPHRQEDVERNLSTSIFVDENGVYDLSPFTSREN